MSTSPPGPNSPPLLDATKAEGETADGKLAPEDYYYEGPYLVFTAAYHLKRGYCCNSGCRHCPYRDSSV
jgi:hypothetical protein